jgi:hypothetical protein
VKGGNVKRHLSRSALEEYLGHESPSVLAIPGTPTCRLVVEPQRRRIALRAAYDGRPLPSLDLEYVELGLISDGPDRWYQIAVTYAQHPHESYLFLSDISDLLQQGGCTFDVAVESVVDTFEQLLAHSHSLSREKEIGLLGELLFLRSCIQASTVDAAVNAWKGFAANEHDFVFPSGGFEIKSTTSEARRHRISGLNQLEPLPDSPLWLISIQLTSGTPSTGRTLTDIVDEVRQLTADDPVLNRALARAGWRDRDRATYRTHYRLRSNPKAYLVNDTFPALTRAAVQRGCVHPELIVDASYLVDVTPLPGGDPPPPADHFITRVVA